MKIRQTERPMGARLRLAREKCLPRPAPVRAKVENRAFRQVAPQPNILFIPRGSRLCFEMVQASLATEDRFERARQESNERIRNSMYNLRREGAGNVS